MKSKLSTIKEAKKKVRKDKKFSRQFDNLSFAQEEVKKNPKYYGYGKLQLPSEVIYELKVLKLAYEIAWADKVDWDNITEAEADNIKLPKLTYGDLMGRLIAGAKRNDPEILQYLNEARNVGGSQERWRCRRKGMIRLHGNSSVSELLERERKGEEIDDFGLFESIG